MNFTKIGYITGATYSIAYIRFPPKADPPPHIHHWTNGWFYFEEGGIEIFSSNEMYSDPNKISNGVQQPKAYMHRYITKLDDLIYGSAYYIHDFRNEGNVGRSLINV